MLIFGVNDFLLKVCKFAKFGACDLRIDTLSKQLRLFFFVKHWYIKPENMKMTRISITSTLQCSTLG